MRSVIRNEIEYLGLNDGLVAADPKLIDEMCRRLDALRRYDQNFCDCDWRPLAAEAGWRPDSHMRAI